MKEVIFEWVKNVAYYMILLSALLHVVPNEEYRKYIRLFTGMVLILLVSSPILSLPGTEMEEVYMFNADEFEDKLGEIQKETEYLYEIDVSSYVADENQERAETKDIKIHKIEVGE